MPAHLNLSGIPMTTFSVGYKTAVLALTLGAALTLASEARASDRKVFSAAAVCAPYTSSAPDYAKLRFRAEGIINDADASKFVICSIPRDSEDGWAADGSDFASAVLFRRTTSGTPAITSNQCVWTVGNNVSEPLQSVTVPATPISATYAYSILDTPPSGDSNSYALVVCRIAPGSLMDSIILEESGVTYVPPI